MHFLKLTAIFSSLLVSVSLYAQSFKKGFIINPDGDTLHGLVREGSYESLSLSIDFKTDRHAEVQHFSAAQLMAFGFKEGDYFESQPVRFSTKTKDGWQEVGGQRFLYRLVAGPISLYELRDGQEMPLFIKKQGHALQLLCFDKEGQPEYRQVLQTAVADCPQLVFPEKIKLEAYAIQSLVEDYNGCGSLEKRHQVPYVQVWGFGSLSMMAFINEYEGWGKGLAAEIRPFKRGFGSRWTVGLDYENLAYTRDYGYDFEKVRLHEISLKTRFYLPNRNAHFSPYGLFGARYSQRKSERGYHFSSGETYVEKIYRDKALLFQVGVGVHAQFGRHLFRLEVPFDRSVSFRLGYGVKLGN